MRNLRLLLVLLLGVGLTTLSAQETLTEGTIVFEITDISSDDPAINQQMAMMKGSTMSILLSKDRQLTEMSMMNGMVKQKTIVDIETKEMNMYMDAMGQKLKVNIPDTDEDEGMPSPEIKYFPEDRKEIAGYDAYKVIISSEMDGQKNQVIAYITEAFTFDGEILRNTPGASEIKGVPLEYTVSQPQVSMTFTATKVSEEVDASAFDFDKSGYKEMTQEQLQQMGGGMGF